MLKLIPIIALFLCIFFNTKEDQVKSPYEKWNIKPVGELRLSDFHNLEEIEDSIKVRLGYKDVCNKRVLAKVKIGDDGYFNTVFYKYCPYNFPVLIPKIKIVVDSSFNKLDKLSQLVKTSLDSLSKETGTNKNNFAVVWNRKYCNKEIQSFFEATDSIYKNKYIDYGREGTHYYDFPLMFFALMDVSHWDLKDTIRPPLNVKFENDSIIIIE